MRESPRDRRLRSFAARVGQDSGRSAPCVQPNTPDGHQRENVRSARQLSPRRVQFSVAKSVQFSVAIDSGVFQRGGVAWAIRETIRVDPREVARRPSPWVIDGSADRLGLNVGAAGRRASVAPLPSCWSGIVNLLRAARSCPVKSMPPIVLSRRTSPHPIQRTRGCGADGGEPTARGADRLGRDSARYREPTRTVGAERPT